LRKDLELFLPVGQKTAPIGQCNIIGIFSGVGAGDAGNGLGLRDAASSAPKSNQNNAATCCSGTAIPKKTIDCGSDGVQI
jgi:hypothetical protein